MKALLILAHGSKRKETEEIVDSIVDKVKSITGETMVDAAYMEMSRPCIEESVEQIIAKGATEIYAVPMFIFDGVHVTRDIPELLKSLQKKHPNVKIILGRHMGADDRIAQIVAENARKIGF